MHTMTERLIAGWMMSAMLSLPAAAQSTSLPPKPIQSVNAPPNSLPSNGNSASNADLLPACATPKPTALPQTGCHALMALGSPLFADQFDDTTGALTSSPLSTAFKQATTYSRQAKAYLSAANADIAILPDGADSATTQTYAAQQAKLDTAPALANSTQASSTFGNVMNSSNAILLDLNNTQDTGSANNLDQQDCQNLSKTSLGKNVTDCQKKCQAIADDLLSTAQACYDAAQIGKKSADQDKANAKTFNDNGLDSLLANAAPMLANMLKPSPSPSSPANQNQNPNNNNNNNSPSAPPAPSSDPYPSSPSSPNSSFPPLPSVDPSPSNGATPYVQPSNPPALVGALTATAPTPTNSLGAAQDLHQANASTPNASTTTPPPAVPSALAPSNGSLPTDALSAAVSNVLSPNDPKTPLTNNTTSGDVQYLTNNPTGGYGGPSSESGAGSPPEGAGFFGNSGQEQINQLQVRDIFSHQEVTLFGRTAAAWVKIRKQYGLDNRSTIVERTQVVPPARAPAAVK